ncbi:MAG: hypothetical protein GY898_22990 [Proteobacteria bacterium]|nr:hypothetical protein [Pseudomonadota bacterium]
MPELEIVNGPLSLYWAPVGEAFPTISAAPVGNWLLIGTSGPHNYTEDGVSVSLEKSVEFFRALASGYPRKSFISEADVIVTVQVADLSLSQIRLSLNNNTVTVGAGVDEIELDVGLDPTEMALLVRGVGKSPQFAGGNLQWEIPRCVEAASPELSHVKGEPAVAELTFQLIFNEGEANPAGRLLVQTS